MLVTIAENVIALIILLMRLPLTYFKGFYRLFVWPDRVPIAGKVVLITGGGSGLGRAIALRMAEESARLVLWDVNENGNRETAEQIRSVHPDVEVHTHTVDITNKNLVKTTAQRVLKEVGPVYMLVNNAGVLMGETILELTENQIEQTININLLAHFWTLRALLPQMLESNNGHIVTICSTAGHGGIHRFTDYCASKFGVRGMEESLESELRDVYKKPGVKLTLVCPHVLDTGLVHSIRERFQPNRTVDDAADAIMDQILRQFRYVYFPGYFRILSTVTGVLKEVGPVYMLVNNAGVLMGETILELTENQIEQTININLLAHFWTLRALLPQMLESNNGHIVTICSTAGHGGIHRFTDYCASKFGVRGMEESLESELRDVYKKPGVKLTLVCPHVLDTGLVHSIRERFQPNRTVDDAADAITDQILRQFRYVYFPGYFRILSTVTGNVSHEGRLALADFANISVSSQKTKH